jgi:hypothetical protein
MVQVEVINANNYVELVGRGDFGKSVMESEGYGFVMNMVL